MNLQRNPYRTLSSAVFSALILLAATSVARAQQQNDELSPGIISGASTIATPYSNGLWGEYFPRIAIQHRTEGAGYEYSFTDFRAWVPLYESYDAKALTFFDGAFLLANDANVGMNAVVGQRFFCDDFDRTFGGYVGYDNRDTGVQTVGQVVTGFESLGRIDFRANGYFPTSSDPTMTGQAGFFDPTYVGNNIQLTQLAQYEVAMKGFDAELGGALPKMGDYLRAYLGTYNFQGSGSPQAWGWKTRLESHVTDRMRLYLTVSDDQVFDTNVVFGASFFFPGSTARRVPQYDDFVNKLDEPLIRNEAVAVNRVNKSQLVNATNPVSGADQRVIHVDPDAAAMGDGTVENPYNALQLAQAGSQANDIIFVHPRADGTSTNLTQSLTLQDNQRLLASTTQHMFTATQGTFMLPGYETGNRPSLDSPGVGVTLADNNEVSGFQFSNTGGDSIAGNGITGFNINNNEFNHFGGFGEASVYIENAGGTGVIRNNDVNNTANAGDSGFYVELVDASHLSITGNDLSRVLSAGGNSGIAVEVSPGVNATVNINDNELSQLLAISGHGIYLGSSGNLTADISGNQITHGLSGAVLDYGIFADIDGGTATLTIDDNRIGTFAAVQALDAGIIVEIANAGVTSTRITNNEVSDFLTAGVFN
ncbi:MAG: right-handed parallel beta-helix repeat-containing protein, partial [Blastopirellula sp. JB062]